MKMHIVRLDDCKPDSKEHQRQGRMKAVCGLEIKACYLPVYIAGICSKCSTAWNWTEDSLDKANAELVPTGSKRDIASAKALYERG